LNKWSSLNSTFFVHTIAAWKYSWFYLCSIILATPFQWRILLHVPHI